MKRRLLLLMWIAALTATAQQVRVTSVTPLLNASQAGFYPSLNKSGDKILFSDADAHGLVMLDLKTHAATTISKLDGAGFDAKWSNDGDVYYVTSKVDPKSKLVYRTGMRYSTERDLSEVVLEAQHGAVLPEVGSKGMALKGTTRSFASSNNRGTSLYTTGSQVIITHNGTVHRYTPVESYAGYLWPSLSPSGDKVAFFAAGRGIVVIDLNGNILAELGNYEMPSWYNNDYLVAQNTSDDGYQFTSSQILLLKADGSFKHELTPSTSMTMQPTCGGGKIAYTTIDGKLTMITIDIVE